ncbi:hypothetical protein R1flu_003004 [Riccia fluitans]|uniref:Uncharacterized protein n=1 Tax=Riccia fluitans TaxID=41844 RepID=A0ABD1Y7R4_9MARC
MIGVKGHRKLLRGYIPCQRPAWKSKAILQPTIIQRTNLGERCPPWQSPDGISSEVYTWYVEYISSGSTTDERDAAGQARGNEYMKKRRAGQTSG